MKEIPGKILTLFKEQYGCWGHINEKYGDSRDLMIYNLQLQSWSKITTHLSKRSPVYDAACLSSILLTDEILDMLADLSAAESKFAIQSLIDASGTNKQ